MAGGGTGGHFFPALELARALKRAGDEVLFVGVRRGIEAKKAPEEGFPIRFVPFEGVRGRGIGALFRALFKLPVSVALCVGAFVSTRASGALLTGGYTSFPVAVAAMIAGRPFFVHEQNSVPGWSNLIISRFAREVWVSFEGSARRFAGRVRHTGNVVRRGFFGPFKPPRSSPFVLLVLGGSLGARSINRAVADAASLLCSLGVRLVHQTGSADAGWVAEAYRGISAEAVEFIEDMPSAVFGASFVLSRAGATTLFELATAGRGALLVPYPHAVGDHQRVNAQEVAKRGGAVVLDNSQCTGERVVRELLPFVFNRRLVLAVAKRMRGSLRGCLADRLVEGVRREVSV